MSHNTYRWFVVALRGLALGLAERDVWDSRRRTPRWSKFAMGWSITMANDGPPVIKSNSAQE